MTAIKILIATHKSYEFPKTDYYVPIQVGKALTKNGFGIIGDDSGDNISIQNSSFCELTALYWAWKNHFFDDAEYIGLVHYRRYFKGKDITLKNKKIASDKELINELENFDAIVAKKRNYYIETIYEHYKHAHHIKDLDLTGEIIKQYFPEYFSAFEKVMEGKTLFLFNMFILKKKDVESYCEWLFDILFKLKCQVDISNYSSYQKRVFGFIAERLLNVWLLKQGLKLKEIRIVNLEKKNFLLKIIKFLKRKYIGGG